MTRAGGGLQAEQSPACRRYCNGDGGARTLGELGDDETDADEDQRAGKAGNDESGDIDGLGNIAERILQNDDAEKEQTESGQGFAERPGPALAGDEVAAWRRCPMAGRARASMRTFTPTSGDQPAGRGGAEIGAEHNPDRLWQVEEARIDEADRGDRDGCGGLRDGGDRGNPLQARAGVSPSSGGEDAAQR